MPDHFDYSSPADRLFTPQSVFWRVNREILVGLGGGRAVLLELAHPLVAAGVAGHSQFKKNPLRRLYRTAEVMNHLIFARQQQAQKALRHFHYCHRSVRGVLAASEGVFSAGTKYSGENPALKFWVLATLLDSALLAYEKFVAPLTLAEKRAYYLEGQKLAHVFGIPFSFIPDTYEEFIAYMHNMLGGATLHIGETAPALVQAILAGRSLRPLTRLLYFVGVGLLPESLRAAYGVTWTDRQEKKLERLARSCRRVRARLPCWMCVNPRAWLAERQYQRRRSQPGPHPVNGYGHPPLPARRGQLKHE